LKRRIIFAREDADTAVKTNSMNAKLIIGYDNDDDAVSSFINK
jgi:hypothetical protein